MVERTDDHPGTGSATYCSAVSLRQASRTLVLAQRSYANNATTSSCMRISPGLGQGHCRFCRADHVKLSACSLLRAAGEDIVSELLSDGGGYDVVVGLGLGPQVLLVPWAQN